MRSPAFERQWLEQVCRHAGLSGLTERFSDAVYNQLERGARTYGEGSFMKRGHAAVGEVSEEAVDLAAWAILYAQFLQAELTAGRLDGDVGMLVQMRLIEASANSLRAWELLTEVEELVQEATRTAAA